jgi:hypothetical protein
MKYIIPFLLLAGCAQAPKIEQPTTFATAPIVPITVEPKAQQMSRNEVIQASMECEAGNMRPVPITSKRMVSGMLSDIIIDVQCFPKRSAMF